MAAMTLVTAFALGAGEALAARVLLAELLARAPAANGQPAMSGLALEACLRQARELDATGTAIDHEIAAIDRLAAEGMFLQRQLDAEMAVLGGYDEKGLNEFQARVIRHEELAKKFQAEFPMYQQKQRAYDAAVVEFDSDCELGFAAAKLGAAKAKLGIK
jgi:hypothetical protein